MLGHLYFDNLIAHIREQFKQVIDKRSEINSTKPLAVALLSGLAMFSLKDSSLLQFVERMKERGGNLKSIFKIKRVISDTTVRKAIDPVGPKQLKAILAQPFQMLGEAGVLAPYECLGGHLLIPIDGTGYFSSKDVHCENCCEKHHRDGEVTYYHNAISAVIVHPGQREVFPVAMEEITKQDGATKNDCELSAVKCLGQNLGAGKPERAERSSWLTAH